MRGKVLLGILATFLFELPCCADGGIPLWVMSAPTLFAFGLPDGIKGTLFTFVLTLVFLLFVSLIEAIVSSFILKNINFTKLFKILYKANFVSTIIGFLIVIAPIPFEKELLKEPLAYAIVGPWGKFFFYSLLLLNIILLIVSIIVEYYVGKNDLINDYSKKDIKKSFLLSNITSYALPLIIYTIASISFGTYDIQENQYKKINISNIDNIEITKSAFIPKPLTKSECNKMKKTFGIKARCNMKKDYWAGAVAACGGTEHLLSENQYKKISEKIYIINENGDKKYNNKLASKYGFPELRPWTYSKYEIPPHIILWTNKATDKTSHAIPFEFNNSSSSYIFNDGSMDSSKIYAICINNN